MRFAREAVKQHHDKGHMQAGEREDVRHARTLVGGVEGFVQPAPATPEHGAKQGGLGLFKKAAGHGQQPFPRRFKRPQEPGRQRQLGQEQAAQ